MIKKQKVFYEGAALIVVVAFLGDLIVAGLLIGYLLYKVTQKCCKPPEPEGTYTIA